MCAKEVPNMRDIVERLRASENGYARRATDLEWEAADEIEHLRQRIVRLQDDKADLRELLAQSVVR
jgi:hypothetical protein